MIPPNKCGDRAISISSSCENYLMALRFVSYYIAKSILSWGKRRLGARKTAFEAAVLHGFFSLRGALQQVGCFISICAAMCYGYVTVFLKTKEAKYGRICTHPPFFFGRAPSCAGNCQDISSKERWSRSRMAEQQNPEPCGCAVMQAGTIRFVRNPAVFPDFEHYFIFFSYFCRIVIVWYRLRPGKNRRNCILKHYLHEIFEKG